MYLYLIKFKKGNMMKIGITEHVSDRVNTFLNVYEDYGIDFKNSLLIESDSRTIKTLERQLLQDYEEYKIVDDSLKGKDGYTELRDAKIFDSVLEDIEYKQNKFADKKITVKKINKSDIVKKKKRRSQAEIRAEIRRNELVRLKTWQREEEKEREHFFDFLNRNLSNIKKCEIRRETSLLITFSQLDISDKDFLALKLIFSYERGCYNGIGR